MIEDRSHTVLVYGRHTVAELLAKQPALIRMVYSQLASDRALKDTLFQLKIRAGIFSPDILAELGDVNHQGIAARVALPRPIPLEVFFRDYTVTPDSMLVLMSEIQDPHNVGAIIRSAAAFGAAGVLLPEHRQAGVTGTVAKVSAGMIFTLPIISVGNVNQTIEVLKKNGFWIYGLAAEGKNALPREKFDAPAVFVVGNESEGLREKTREHCDILLNIPMHPRAESLNASAAAAVVLSAWSAQHPNALHV